MKIATIILYLLWIGLLLFSLVAIMFSPMMFDAPGSDKLLSVWVIFWSIVALPVTILVSLVLSMRKYSKGDYRSAFVTALVPVLVHLVVVVLAFWGV